MFQFLIGRLETTWRTLDDLDDLVFQFLIGRLETGIPAPSASKVSTTFQFLIGRLETR